MLNLIETVTLRIFVKLGLEQLKKPHDQQLDRDDVFAEAYERATDLLDGEGFFVELDTDEFNAALFAAVIAELAAENLDKEAMLRKAALAAVYFAPGP